MVYVDEKRCSGCGLCMDVCAVGAIGLQEDRATIDQHLCTECEACVVACPEGAVLTVTEPAPAPHTTREVAPYKGQPAAVPVATRIAPAIGAALLFVGREVVPRVASYLVEALDRRMSSPSTIGDKNDLAASPGAEGAGAGRRSRTRHRGRQ